MKIIVLSFNIYKGGGGKYQKDNKADKNPAPSEIIPIYETIADLIIKENADIVALQEVDRETARVGYLDAAKEIARNIDLVSSKKWTYSFFKAKHVGASPGRKHKKEYGNAVLYRLVNGEAKQINLGNTGLIGHDSENRVAMAQEFIIPNEGHDFRFLIINLHLGLERDNQIFQLSKLQVLLDDVSDDTKPIILCGDFNIDSLNATAETTSNYNPLTIGELKKIFRQFKREFVDQNPSNQHKATFGGKKKIDYFFFSDAPDPRFKGRLKCTSVNVVKNSGKECSSDHDALKLKLKFNEASISTQSAADAARLSA